MQISIVFEIQYGGCGGDRGPLFLVRGQDNRICIQRNNLESVRLEPTFVYMQSECSWAN
jgi:hypothetical protein